MSASIALPRAVAALVYGADKHTRIRLQQWSFTLVIYSCYLALYGLSWSWGTTTGLQWAVMAITIYTGEFVFYALIRSGFTRRFRDAALTREQILFGIAMASAGYVIAGPYGTAVLFSLLLTLLFGAFSLDGRTMLQMTAVSVACVAVAMVYTAGGRLGRVEVFDLVTLLFVLPAIAVLSARLGQMRFKLTEHKKSLEEAYARIELLAVRDQLTGLLNRRYMNDALQREQLNNQRASVPACVAMLDIDHFKRINDAHGHSGGDVVLQGFARLAEQTFRGTDLVARWGGEEFLVLMPQTEARDALRALQRLLAAFRDARFDAVNPALRVTVSVGLACFEPGESASALIERADRALYSAKTSGRDRLVLAPAG